MRRCMMALSLRRRTAFLRALATVRIGRMAAAK
jgi:hypothetical protein